MVKPSSTPLRDDPDMDVRALVPSRRCRWGLCSALPVLLLTAPLLAGDDADHPFQRAATAMVDVETTAALPPVTLLPPAVDPARIRAVIDAYRGSGLAAGDALAAAVDDRDARPLLEWVAIRTRPGAVGFARIEAFLAAYPNYPSSDVFRRFAETALIADRKDLDTVRRFLHGREPLTPLGRVATARLLVADGKRDEAAALIRQLWRNDRLRPMEKVLLAEFAEALTTAVLFSILFPPVPSACQKVQKVSI